MKREIKFRGKRIDNGEWVCGSHVTYHKWDDKTQWCHQIITERGDVVGVVPETVGQYTGLKHKNGVEIYEGDIIGFVKDSNIAALKYVVKWIRGGFWLTDRGYGDKLEPQLKDIQSFAQSGGYTTQIIGNIHDNPEMMEGGGE